MRSLVRRRRHFVVGAAALALTASGSIASAATTATSAAAAGAAVPGVTPTTITIGTVADITGPVPGLFQGGINAVQAYAAYINSTGGVNGRQLKVVTADSGLSCAVTKQAYDSIIHQVFALVGSWSDFDNCAVSVMKANPQVTSFNYSLTTEFKALANAFNARPAPPGQYEGPYKYLKSKYPNVVRAGTIYSGTAAGIDSIAWQEAALKSAGIKTVYGFAVPTQPPTDFTSNIIRMRNANVQMLFMDDVDIGTASRVINDAYQQGWHPELVDCAICYDANFKKLVNPAAAQGVYMEGPQALYLGEDSKLVPEVGRFVTWLNKTHPGFPPDLFAAFSWSDAAMFVDALRHAGKNPTQASLQKAMKNIHSFNDNGFLATANPGQRKPPTCWVLAQFRNGVWKRVMPTGAGYRCSPGGYYYAKK